MTERSGRLQEFFDTTPDAIILHDVEGRVLDANDQAVDWLDYTREELTTMRVGDIETTLTDEELRSFWADMEVGDRETTEGRHRRADGSTYPVELSIRKTVIDGDELFLTLSRDVSERKAYQRRLKKQRDNLEILNRVVRHDIRNDLQIVIAYADLLAEEFDEDSEQRAHVETIRSSATNAVELTKTARDLADVMLADGTDLQARNLQNTLEDEIDSVRSDFPGAVVRVEGSIPDLGVRANELLDSVFRNLLKNAIQHNDEDVPEVTITVNEGDQVVRVRIADNGPGVPDDRKESIFGKGEKGLDSEGTGVGLYLVRSLVESYGGAVRVEDNDPTGAVFVVELPAADRNRGRDDRRE